MVSPIIMKLHKRAPHESRMYPILGSKGQGHGTLMTENVFLTITYFVIHLLSRNIHLLPMSQGCALFISGLKGQGHGAIENCFRTITDSVFHLCSPRVKDVSY